MIIHICESIAKSVDNIIQYNTIQYNRMIDIDLLNRNRSLYTYNRIDQNQIEMKWIKKAMKLKLNKIE